MAILTPRRRLLTGALGLAGASLLGGCDRFAGTEPGRRTLRLGEDANLFVQRLLLSPASLAREFPETEVSPWFKPNGTVDPPDAEYRRLAAAKFAEYRLRVDGLVERPLSLGLPDLRALPARTQTTRHDCVEGWSCIGRWTGVPLHEILSRAGLRPQARYVVFHCADTLEYAEDGQGAGQGAGAGAGTGGKAGGKTGGKTGGKGALLRPATPDHVRYVQLAAAGDDAWGGGEPEPEAPDTRTPIRYYESVDLVDAVHPQTILAYDLNGAPLPVGNGAPLRLRVERQLGYKMAKYVMRVEVTDGLAGIGDGLGGYWEDRGYEWYAGI